MGEAPAAARALLNHEPSLSTGSQIGFRSPHANDKAGYMVLLPEDLWQDMQRPETITVTVQPGDLLNTEEPNAEEGEAEGVREADGEEAQEGDG